MNFANVDVRHLRSWARWHKCSWRYRDHLMVLVGKDLARPSAYATTDKNKARNADSSTCYQARETKRDPKGQKDWPRSASRHLDRLSSAQPRTQIIHHDSPSDEIHDCKDHDPDTVYKVPIKSNYAEAFTLPRIDPTEQGEH